MSGEDVAYVMKIDVPGSPKGEEFQIAGLGTFKNGHEYEVTKEEADAYRSYHQRQEPILEDKTNAILGNELVQGPTLLQASKGMYGVEVSTPGSNDDEDESDNNEAPQDSAPLPGPEASNEDDEGGDS